MSLVSGGNVVSPVRRSAPRGLLHFLLISLRPYALGLVSGVAGMIWLAAVAGNGGLVTSNATTFTQRAPSVLLELPGIILVSLGVFQIARFVRLHDRFFRNAKLRHNLILIAGAAVASILLSTFGVSIGYGHQNDRVTQWGLTNLGTSHFNDDLPAPLPIFNLGVAPNIPWVGEATVTYRITDDAGQPLTVHYTGASAIGYTVVVTRG